MTYIASFRGLSISLLGSYFYIFPIGHFWNQIHSSVINNSKLSDENPSLEEFWVTELFSATSGSLEYDLDSKATGIY